MENELQFVIGTMRWSFSRLSAFYNCKKEWYWQYVLANRGAESSFGQFGSFCHEILEKYAKGELDLFSLAPYYEEHYSERITLPFPPNNYVDLAQKYYDMGLEYFSSLALNLDRYEILGVEKEVHFNIGGKEFIGFIDLLLKDKLTGEITILDHKSATLKILKSGKVSKADQAHFEDFKRQLYLYSIPVIKEYGHVDKLKWNMFKQGTFIEISWDKNEFEDALQWAEDTLKLIENETEFAAEPDEFYCRNLCSMREDYCPYRRLVIIYNRIYSKCFGKKSKDYENYGALGIVMSDEWKENKSEFFRWALDNGYDEDKVIKRYDEDGNYDEWNCYWDYPDEEMTYE